MEREGLWPAWSRSRRVTSHDEAGLVPKWHPTVSSLGQESVAHTGDGHSSSSRAAPQTFKQHPKPGGTNASAVGLCSPHQWSVPCLISLKTRTSLSLLSLQQQEAGAGGRCFFTLTSLLSQQHFFMSPQCGFSGGPGKWERGKGRLQWAKKSRRSRRKGCHHLQEHLVTRGERGERERGEREERERGEKGERGEWERREREERESPALTKLPHLYPKQYCAAVWYLHHWTHLVPYSRQQCKIHPNSWTRIFLFQKIWQHYNNIQTASTTAMSSAWKYQFAKIFHLLLGQLEDVPSGGLDTPEYVFF